MIWKVTAKIFWPEARELSTPEKPFHNRYYADKTERVRFPVVAASYVTAKFNAGAIIKEHFPAPEGYDKPYWLFELLEIVSF